MMRGRASDLPTVIAKAYEQVDQPVSGSDLYLSFQLARIIHQTTNDRRSMTNTLNRRSFLVAGGMTALASTRAWGANDTLRIGVIGAGGRMNSLLDAADKAGTCEIVAVSDVYTPHRDAVKEKYNGTPTTHLHYEEILSQNLDAVLIAAPDHWHVKMAVDAIASGKDVYLEKPVTHTIEEGATLTHAVRSSKQILQLRNATTELAPLSRCR